MTPDFITAHINKAASRGHPMKYLGSIPLSESFAGRPMMSESEREFDDWITAQGTRHGVMIFMVQTRDRNYYCAMPHPDSDPFSELSDLTDMVFGEKESVEGFRREIGLRLYSPTGMALNCASLQLPDIEKCCKGNGYRGKSCEVCNKKIRLNQFYWPLGEKVVHEKCLSEELRNQITTRSVPFTFGGKIKEKVA